MTASDQVIVNEVIISIIIPHSFKQLAVGTSTRYSWSHISYTLKYHYKKCHDPTLIKVDTPTGDVCSTQ